VALSTADSNNWSHLIESVFESPIPTSESTTLDYQLVGPIRQRQRRLTEARTLELVDRYESGATVYELAKEFRCSRQTVSERLKKAGVTMRHQSPTPEVIDAMVRLYLSELSLVEVGKQFGFYANSVASCLRKRGIQVRDTHGRSR
jgi:YesN/AraC family two-component response regulator